MMSVEQVKASYRRSLRERVGVRRYTSVGKNRTKVEVANVRARIVGYQEAELVGTIQQGDRRAILYADDVTSGGIPMLTANDKILTYENRELAIIAVDDSTCRIDGVLVAYFLQLRG